MGPNMTLKLVWRSLEFFWAITCPNRVSLQHTVHFPIFDPFLYWKKSIWFRFNFSNSEINSRDTCDRDLRLPHCVTVLTMTSFDCLPGLGVFQEVCNKYSVPLSRIAFRFESCALCLAQPGAVAYVLYCKLLELSIYGNYFLRITSESGVWCQTNNSTKFERSWIKSMQVSEHLVWISFSAPPCTQIS